MIKMIVMTMLHSVIVCEVVYNANHIQVVGSDNDEGDSDGCVSAGLRGFTLSLCVRLGIMLIILKMRGVIMMKMIGMAM